MQLDLSRLRSGVEAVQRRYDPSALARPDDDLRIVAPVELDVEVHKDAKKVRLTGRLKAVLECDCSRCLEPYPVPVDVALDLIFLPLGTAAVQKVAAPLGDDGLEVGDDDLGVSFYENDVIELGEMMREQFYLALPMKPLCRPDCAGLCPVCGINRNRETCTCQSEWVDPRMDPLRALKKKD